MRLLRYLALALLALAGAPAFAQTTISALPAGTTPNGTEVFPGDLIGGCAGNTCKWTSAQIGNAGTLTGDCAKSTSSTAVTCTKTNGVAFGTWATSTDTTTGSGTVLVLQNAPALTTPNIGAATGTSLATTGALTVTESIGATSTDGGVLQNTTAAAVGAQQWSPRLHLIGQGWKTNATAGSQTVDWILENQPVQGAASPSSNLVFSSQVNAGGYAAALTIPSGGGLNLASGTYQIGGTQIAASNLSNGTTGSGAVVLATSPGLTTPNIGAATATTVNGNTFTTGTYTLTGAASKTLTFNNSLTLAGTDATTMTFPGTSQTIPGIGSAQTWTGAQTFQLEIPTVSTATSATSVTPNCTFNVVKVTASATGTFTVNAPGTCTPADGQRLELKVISPAGGTVTYAWNAAYIASATLALPATSNAASKEDYFSFQYDSDKANWVFLAMNQGF